jgi:hypothetical protein
MALMMGEDGSATKSVSGVQQGIDTELRRHALAARLAMSPADHE